MKWPEVIRGMQDMVVTPVGDQAEEFAAFIKTEIDKWGKIVRAMGLTRRLRCPILRQQEKVCGII